jgi:hypothetical protein
MALPENPSITPPPRDTLQATPSCGHPRKVQETTQGTHSSGPPIKDPLLRTNHGPRLENPFQWTHPSGLPPGTPSNYLFSDSCRRSLKCWVQPRGCTRTPIMEAPYGPPPGDPTGDTLQSFSSSRTSGKRHDFPLGNRLQVTPSSGPTPEDPIHGTPSWGTTHGTHSSEQRTSREPFHGTITTGTTQVHPPGDPIQVTPSWGPPGKPHGTPCRGPPPVDTFKRPVHGTPSKGTLRKNQRGEHTGNPPWEHPSGPPTADTSKRPRHWTR